jgi:hypothetical protein
MNDEVSAGSVPCGNGVLYEVTFTHDHKTLKPGDRVGVVECPHCRRNLLGRLPDFTLHDICGEHDQYVHLRPVKQEPPTIKPGDHIPGF